jgi:hypothetical protein
MAILEVARTIKDMAVTGHRVIIYSDSQASLKALNSSCIRSRIVAECIDELNKVADWNSVSLHWIRGHAGTEGNEIADELAREGSATSFIGPEPVIGVPTSRVRSSIRRVADQLHDDLWDSLESCRQVKRFEIKRSSGRARELLNLSRENIRVVLSLLTGHGGFKKHLHKLGLAMSPLCHLCGLEDDTAEHFICRCEKVTFSRLISLGNYHLTPSEIGSEVKPSSLLSFTRDSGRWEEFAISD